MNEPTKEQWQELHYLVTHVDLHKGDMMCAIREENKWDAMQAYKNLQNDLNDILLWLNGALAANITEKGDQQ